MLNNKPQCKCFVDSAGNKFYYKNYVMHRINGPAAEFKNGDKFWYVDNRLHREDGPAVMRANGSVQYCLRGIEYTEHEWHSLTTTSR